MRRPAKKRNRVAASIRLFFRYLNAGVVLCSFAGAGFVLGSMHQLNALMPHAEELWDYRPRLATEIYSTEMHKDGTETHTLLAKVFDEDREQMELRHIPSDLVNATVAIEDRRFYDHSGISPRDILRAVWVDIRHKKPLQGASTITQQLVRNVWLSHEKSWDRKLKEAVLALETERKYSKDEIIEMYLNEVCYGHGAFGVKTAARLYYNKQPKDLKLHECAMLAGLPQWPVGYSPYRHPERCKKRRNAVLRWMLREGKITPGEHKKASEVPIDKGLAPLRERGVVAKHAPHFTHWVIRQLRDEYGYDVLYQGGLRVYTTIDLRLQEVAEKELTQQVERLRRRGSMKRGVSGGQGALACVEVKTGRVLAMVGGVGPYEQIQTNRAHPGPPGYGRQPGSSFKPYVWACALENGYGPNSVFSAEPINIGGWTPKNWSPSQGGTYTLRAGLRDSVNLVSVRIVQKMGVAKVRRLAARMLGIPKERLDPYPALALGVSNLSPLEQALGYCCLANSGLRPTCRAVRRIENQEGQVLYNYAPELVRVIQSTTAASMLSMLRTVVQSGTGTRARACGRPCGGKTGTTNKSTNVWWVGITPELSAAVWLGNEKPSRMYGASGGGWCGPVWARFIKQASEILGCDGQFPEGPGVTATERGERAEKEGTKITVCVMTGLRATQYCPQTKFMWVMPEEPMPGICDVNSGPGRIEAPGNPSGEPATGASSSNTGTVTRRVCPTSGQLATPYCPSAQLLRFPAGRAPSGYCKIHGPQGASGHARPAPPSAGPGDEGVDEPGGVAPGPPDPDGGGAMPSGPGGADAEPPAAEPATEPAPSGTPPLPVEEPGSELAAPGPDG